MWKNKGTEEQFHAFIINDIDVKNFEGLKYFLQRNFRLVFKVNMEDHCERGKNFVVGIAGKEDDLIIPKGKVLLIGRNGIMLQVLSYVIFKEIYSCDFGGRDENTITSNPVKIATEILEQLIKLNGGVEKIAYIMSLGGE